jgi:hypothetical protein
MAKRGVPYARGVIGGTFCTGERPRVRGFAPARLPGLLRLEATSQGLGRVGDAFSRLRPAIKLHRCVQTGMRHETL